MAAPTSTRILTTTTGTRTQESVDLRNLGPVADRIMRNNLPTIEELQARLLVSDKYLTGEIGRIWQLIRIDPERWTYEHVHEGGCEYFWVVAIVGRHVIWYNHVDKGFNECVFQEFGRISEYSCDEYDLHQMLFQLINYRIQGFGKV